MQDYIHDFADLVFFKKRREKEKEKIYMPQKKVERKNSPKHSL